MSENIRLHKEFGLNPTMPICIICHEDKGEIALLGSAYKGEAPMKMLVDIQPCDKCTKKYLKKGTLLVEMENKIPEGKSKAQMIPTGAVTVLKDSAFEGVFNQKVPKGKIVQVEIGILKMLQDQVNEAHAEEKKQ